jgi:hypothetical protein
MAMALAHRTNVDNAGNVPERVTDADLGIVWDPNAPDALLLATDHGETRLRLRARADDSDQHPVVLVWQGAIATRMEPVNDEGCSRHRLHDAGLRGILWVGEVYDSELIAEFERQRSVQLHPAARMAPDLHHWIVTLKECTVEVVASSLGVRRHDRHEP